MKSLHRDRRSFLSRRRLLKGATALGASVLAGCVGQLTPPGGGGELDGSMRSGDPDGGLDGGGSDLGTDAGQSADAGQSGAPGTWQLLLADPNPGGRTNLGGWANPVLDLRRDCLYYMNWGGEFNALDLGTGAWTNAGSIEQPPGGGTHNRSQAYDPTRDRIWVSDGTYGRYTEFCMTWWGVADNSRGKVNNSAPTNPYRNPGYQSAMYYHAATDSLVAWGGWGGQSLRKLSCTAPIDTPWQDVAVTGAAPPTSAEADKFTIFKTAWDSRRSRWITVSSYSEAALYFLPEDLSAWSKELPDPHGAGEYPPPATWWVYDDAGDQLIGFSGSAATATGQPVMGEPLTTWRVRLGQTPLRFEKLASAAAGDSVPGPWAMNSCAMSWDPTRKRAFWFEAGNGFNPYRVWVYYPPPA